MFTHPNPEPTLGVFLWPFPASIMSPARRGTTPPQQCRMKHAMSFFLIAASSLALCACASKPVSSGASPTSAASKPEPKAEPKAERITTALDEAPMLTNHVQLTSRDQFVKAGEAYFSPDGKWIIFQAVPVPEAGKEADPFYAMYVAKLERDAKGNVTGLSAITRVSAEGSANTCGWFHPTNPQRVLFGSTSTRPTDEGKSGFQVGTRRYVWMFPEGMDVVEWNPFVIGQDGVTRTGTKRMAPMPTPVFTLPNYDAECSYSKDGRFILYAHIEDAPAGTDPIAPRKPDANIYVFDTKTKRHHAIVKAPGYDGGPFFSPDGKSICYRSDREGNDLLQIFVADLKFEKGADGAMVPVGIQREYQLTKNEHVNWAPYWHPSGTFLVYASSEVGHSNYEVFAVEVDRGELNKAAKAATPTIDASKARRQRVTKVAGADVLPVFTPDGSLMMWTAQRGPLAAGETKPSSQLWIAEVGRLPFEEAGSSY